MKAIINFFFLKKTSNAVWNPSSISILIEAPLPTTSSGHRVSPQLMNISVLSTSWRSKSPLCSRCYCSAMIKVLAPVPLVLLERVGACPCSAGEDHRRPLQPPGTSSFHHRALQPLATSSFHHRTPPSQIQSVLPTSSRSQPPRWPSSSSGRDSPPPARRSLPKSTTLSVFLRHCGEEREWLERERGRGGCSSVEGAAQCSVNQVAKEREESGDLCFLIFVFKS